MLRIYLPGTLEVASLAYFMLSKRSKRILIFHEEENCPFLHGRTTGLIANINVVFIFQEATKPFYYNLINMNQGTVASGSRERHAGSFLQACSRTTPAVWAR